MRKVKYDDIGKTPGGKLIFMPCKLAYSPSHGMAGCGKKDLTIPGNRLYLFPVKALSGIISYQ
jgi:hypothetical protein